jgi:hypothetical protein
MRMMKATWVEDLLPDEALERPVLVLAELEYEVAHRYAHNDPFGEAADLGEHGEVDEAEHEAAHTEHHPRGHAREAEPQRLGDGRQIHGAPTLSGVR